MWIQKMSNTGMAFQALNQLSTNIRKKDFKKYNISKQKLVWVNAKIGLYKDIYTYF